MNSIKHCYKIRTRLLKNRTTVGFKIEQRDEATGRSATLNLSTRYVEYLVAKGLIQGVKLNKYGQLSGNGTDLRYLPKMEVTEEAYMRMMGIERENEHKLSK